MESLGPAQKTRVKRFFPKDESASNELVYDPPTHPPKNHRLEREWKERQTVSLEVGREVPSPHLSKGEKGKAWEMSKFMEQTLICSSANPTSQTILRRSPAL